MHIYGELLVAMFIDQLKYIFDKNIKEKLLKKTEELLLPWRLRLKKKVLIRYSEIPKI
ncbi:MAG: hypothetical protein ABIY50_04545 [Ignavibacteria bacterium]